MFNIFLPTKIIFGQGSVEHLPDSIKNLGNKAMIVTGKKARSKAVYLIELYPY